MLPAATDSLAVLIIKEPISFAVTPDDIMAAESVAKADATDCKLAYCAVAFASADLTAA